MGEEEARRQREEEEEKQRKNEAQTDGNMETEKKSATSRPTKSILSNMLRSSLSQPHHDKLHDSSMVSARSSQINATPVQSNIVMATDTVHMEKKTNQGSGDDIADIFAEAKEEMTMEGLK